MGHTLSTYSTGIAINKSTQYFALILISGYHCFTNIGRVSVSVPMPQIPSVALVIEM
jgi:hypothetical protein